MPEETWVGFARSPKPNLSLQKCSVAETLETDLPVEVVFQKTSSAEGLSSWLTAVSSSDVRTSGKINFASNENQSLKAVFSLVEIGRKVVINSERFGEISISLKKQKASTAVEISFTKMVSEEFLDSSRAEFLSALQRLKQELRTAQ